MNIFEKFLYFLQGEMNRPNPWGWFHILWIIVMLLVIFILYKVRNRYSEKRLKIVLATYGVIAFILELLKQLIWAFNYDPVTQIVTWDYTWYAAPFQLCTTPIYVSLICLFLKKGKVRTALFSYLSYITILGSIATIILPDSVFTHDILINIHTMYLHLGSFVVSVYLFMNKEVEINFKSLRNAFLVFLIFVLIANTMNIIVYNSGILNGDTFNMFYISPYFTSVLPLFDYLYTVLPYPIYLLSYIITIGVGASIIYLLAFLIKKIFKK